MRKPLTEEDPRLPHVNFYSFTGDRRPDPLCKCESGTGSATESHPAEEGFSILASALRQAQTGLASRAQFGRRKVPVPKNQREGQQ